MAEWLKRCGIRTVAMQSTGVYWVAVQEVLEDEGLEVYLVNARGTKNLPGRKSDVQECRWLMKLHTYGRQLVKSGCVSLPVIQTSFGSDTKLSGSAGSQSFGALMS
jgi:hypothetical protein